MIFLSQGSNRAWLVFGPFIFLVFSSHSAAQLTIAHLGQSDPSNIFVNGIPSDPLTINTFKRINEGDDTGAQIARNRGQVFFAPDTGDANNGWSLTDVTVRWDDTNGEYPINDFQVRLSIYPWQDLGNPEASNVDFDSGPTELPLQPIYSEVGLLPFLTPDFDLFDGDRLRFSLGSSVQLRENTAYGFLIEFDRNDGTALRIDDDAIRLEGTNVGSAAASIPGSSLGTNFDYSVNGLTQLNSQVDDDLIHQLSGVSANISANPFASLEVDRDTGNLSIKTNLDALADINLTAYSITTTNGHVLTGDADWSSFADGSIDWQENGTAGPMELSETFVGIGSEQLTQSQTIDLGNAWEVSPFEDLVMTVETAGGTTITVPVRYVSSVGGTEAIQLGDYNLNGTIDIGDWPTVRDNLLSDVSSLGNFDRYLSGDMNRNGTVDETDFLLFRDAFEAAHGLDSFEVALAAIPEPSAVFLVFACLLVVLSNSRYGNFSQRHIRSIALSKVARNIVCAVVIVLSAQKHTQAELLHHYEFEVGSELLDSIGSNSLISTSEGLGTITFANGIASHTGGNDGGLTDNGTQLQTTSNIGLGTVDDWTVAFLVRDMDGSDDLDFSGMVSSGTGGGGGPNTWQIDYRGDPVNQIVGEGNNNSNFGTLSDGEFHHIAVVHDADGAGSGITVYFDGSTAGVTNNWASERDVIDEFYLFRNRGGNRYFNGDLDDVRIYDNALMESEIQDLVPGFGDDLLTLEVNITTGQVNILGSDTPQNVIAYRVETDDNSATLDFPNWTGLDLNNFDDAGWERAGGSSQTAVAEVRLEGATTFDMNTTASLGALYDETTDLQNLNFTFIRDDQSVATGLVRYVTGSTSGDFDSDGDVDGQDFLLWQRGGSPNPLSSSDLALWQTNYGLEAGSSATAISTVPEPASALLIALSTAAFLVKRMR